MTSSFCYKRGVFSRGCLVGLIVGLLLGGFRCEMRETNRFYSSDQQQFTFAADGPRIAPNKTIPKGAIIINEPEIFTCHQPNTRKATSAEARKVWNIFEEWLEIFREVNLTSWFLHAGSLLHFVRSCEMAYDDVDFAIPLPWWSDPNHQQRLKAAIKKRGYRYRWNFGAFGTPGRFGYEESWTKNPLNANEKDVLKVDLFSIVEQESSYIWAMWTGPIGKKTAWPCQVHRQQVVDAKWYSAKNNTKPLVIRVPFPFDPALVSLYGKEWKKPFPGTWRWDVEPFTVGSCSRDLKDVAKIG